MRARPMRRSRGITIRGIANNAIGLVLSERFAIARSVGADTQAKVFTQVFAPEARRILAGGGAQRNHRSRRRNLFPAPEGRQTELCLSPLRGWEDNSDCVRWFLHRLISSVPPGRRVIEDRGSRIEGRGSEVEQRYSMRSSILDPRSSILDPRSSILDPRSSILDPRSSILL